MIRVRNADGFRIELRRIRDSYDTVFRPQIAALRAKYANVLAAGAEIDQLLEIHARDYHINALLAALNWRRDSDPASGLPNLVPEVAVAAASEHPRFLDYLGLDTGDDDPLLIVEAKRPSAELPLLVDEPSTTPVQDPEIFRRGLRGAALSGDWPKWLEAVRDYIERVRSRAGRPPRRVLLTNGEWLVAFREPAAAFIGVDGPINVEDILVIRSPSEWDYRANEVFQWLEHQSVLNETAALTVGEVPFEIDAEDVELMTHGLRVHYIEQPGIYTRTPVILVAPVVFVRERFGAWIRVESPGSEYALPGGYEALPEHLNEVDQAARTLFDDVTRRLGLTVAPASLEDHYADAARFDSMPAVVESGRDQFLIVTGVHTHYLRVEPSVPGCPYHDYAASRKDGFSDDQAIVLRRSITPRAFFMSGEQHHCSHREVARAKSMRITLANRERCGARSGQEESAFCEIWRFEQLLCCRTCVFESVCTKAPVFQLPCGIESVRRTGLSSSIPTSAC